PMRQRLLGLPMTSLYTGTPFQLQGIEVKCAEDRRQCLVALVPRPSRPVRGGSIAGGTGVVIIAKRPGTSQELPLRLRSTPRSRSHPEVLARSGTGLRAFPGPAP